MYPADGEARKATADAMSSGFPSLLSGTYWSRSCCCFSESARVISVSTKPGATQFTVILRLPKNQDNIKAPNRKRTKLPLMPETAN